MWSASSAERSKCDVQSAPSSHAFHSAAVSQPSYGSPARTWGIALTLRETCLSRTNTSLAIARSTVAKRSLAVASHVLVGSSGHEREAVARKSAMLM
jgi:hypothetical protein